MLVSVIFGFNSIELKGFSIRNFVDEKYKGGNCELTVISAGNNSRSSDIVRPNFENVLPISHYDRTL